MEPIKIDPASTVDLWLPAHDAVDPASRQVFVFAFPTARKQREAWKLDDESKKALDADDEETWVAKLFEALRVGLKGYRNVPGNPRLEDVDNLISPGEARALLNRWYAATRVTPEERKGFSSPSPAGGAASAETAGAAGAKGAGTGPASPNP